MVQRGGSVEHDQVCHWLCQCSFLVPDSSNRAGRAFAPRGESDRRFVASAGRSAATAWPSAFDNAVANRVPNQTPFDFICGNYCRR
jgi:hypothetical protein